MKAPRVNHPRPPPHVSASCKRWWSDVVSGYVLEGHHLRLLQLAAEAWDENEAAREVLAKDGLVIAGREGGLRPHPAVAIARDARLAFARLIRELDLDTEPPVPSRIGPPPLRSNSGRARDARQAPQPEGSSVRRHPRNSGALADL